MGSTDWLKAGAQIFKTVQSAKNINAADAFHSTLTQQQEQYRKQQMKKNLLIGGGIMVTAIIIAVFVAKT